MWLQIEPSDRHALLRKKWAVSAVEEASFLRAPKRRILTKEAGLAHQGMSTVSVAG